MTYESDLCIVKDFKVYAEWIQHRRNTHYKRKKKKYLSVITSKQTKDRQIGDELKFDIQLYFHAQNTFLNEPIFFIFQENGEWKHWSIVSL